MGHAVQQRDGLVGVDGDKHIARVGVDVIVHKTGMEEAEKRRLVKAVQLCRVLGNDFQDNSGKKVL